MRIVEDERAGCFTLTFKDKEEAFLNLYYKDGFRDDVVISPFNKEDARDFAMVLQKMITRRMSHDFKRL